MVLEALGQALQYFMDPIYLLLMLLGIMIGIIVGILPGIGGLMALALLLPFIFNVPAELALPLMIALDSVAVTGGSITAILLNIPGESANAATMLDGFPMAKKGQAGRALGAALAASGTGGAVTVFVALAMIPLVLPMVYAITSADMVFIILLGLTFIGVLGRGGMIKGMISGGIGLMVSFIGLQAVTATARFTFGSVYLYDGIGLVPLSVGLFAIPEMIDLAAKGGSIAMKEMEIGGMRQVLEGVKDVFRHWTLWLRSSVIGYIIGIIPGIGGMTSVWIAYGQAKQTSKHPEQFGTGIVEGIIAPQSAVCACRAGDVLVTLALGIPGGAAMALLLGAFLIVGLTPGPRMLTDHLPLSLNLLLMVLVANLIGAVICLLVAPHLAKVATMPGRILVPLVLVAAIIGSYASQADFRDVIVTIIFTALGWGLSKFGFNRPAFFLGYIMGLLFEKYLFLAIKAQGGLFFMRPISLTMIVIIIGLFIYQPLTGMFRRRKGVKTA